MTESDRGDASRIGQLSDAKRALLEQRLRAREAARAGAAASNGGAAAKDSAPVLSFAQERLWLLAELTPGLSAYNTTRVVRVDGRVDAPRLRTAVRAVLERHQILRTHVIPDAEGRPHATIAAAAEPVFELAERADEAAALDVVASFAARPFDLARDDLLRALVVRVPGGDVLAVSLHHIASDEASRKVLWDDLSAAYTGAALPQLERQYADFARLQRTEFDQPAMLAEIGWWTRHLDGAPQVIDLPADHQRPQIQTYRGARHQVSLDPELVAALRSFAGGRGATLFMTVLAGFEWMLHQWARTDDVVVGMPVSGRDRPETEGLIGLLVNTVVVRADCSGTPNFAELVDRVRVGMLGALEHQTVPFDKVVEAIAPARDVSRNPVFQVLVNAITSEHEAEFTLGELRARVIDFDPQTTKFDIGLLVAERPNGSVELVFEYASDLFAERTIADLAAEVGTLLAAATAAPDRPLPEVSALPAEQARRLVQQVNATDGPFPDACLHELIALQAQRTPDRPAIADEAGSLTYRELDERTNALAHHLISLGVGPGVPVAVSVRRSVAMELAVLAVLKAGGAYVPLDTDYPQDRLAYMLDDCAAPVLITERAVVDGLPPHPNRVLVDDLDDLLANAPTTPPDTGVTPDDLAYVIYTSGSTGQPKGVQLAHRGVVNRLDWMQRTFELTERDTVLQKTPLSFDVSVWEVLWPLLTGARLFLARPEGHRDVAYLHDVIARERVTVLHFVPSMLATFLETPGTRTAAGRVRVVVCSGEALPFDVKERFFETLPDAQLHNLYGPTEASIDVTWSQCRPGAAHRVLIGAPISNVQVYVTDDDHRPVPVGVPGELYLAGVQLARGYLGRPDLTAERFVDFPLAPDGRAYRTGDIVRWTSDGQLDYLGRIDGQVKLRGFRIELGEIETVLGSARAVSQCTVVLAPAPSGEPVLAAYVVLDPDSYASPPESTVQVDEWNSVWEQTYDQPDVADPFFDTSGWLSSFTGEPIPADEMAEWVDATVARIGALGGRAILEVGSGTGLLLWRLAPTVERFVATDFTASVTERLRRLGAQAGIEALSVLHLAADEVDSVSVGTDFDTVVLNSVIQYFPDIDYLGTVLEHAGEVLGPGGRIFVGDVRDLRRHDAFALRVELATAPPTTVGELALRVHDRRVLDGELLVDPTFFAARPGVGHIQVLPKRAAARNEMTCFRYDVVLHGTHVAPVDLADWHAWPADGGLAEIEHRLAAGEIFGVQGIPDDRIVDDRAAAAALAAGRLPDTTPLGRAARPAEGIGLEQLDELAERYGYHLELSVLADPWLIDAALTRSVAPVRFPSPRRTAAALSNDPAGARRQAVARANAVTELTAVARTRLPEYMVPTSLQVLPWLPLTPNGKLDRAALPGAIERRALGEARIEPRTDTERHLASIWAEVLGVGEIGVDDNFFRLGGHSLLAVRLVAAIARAMGVTIALRTVFETPTVAALAAEVDRLHAAGGGPVLAPVDRAPRRARRAELSSDAELSAAAAGLSTHADADTDSTVFPLSAAQERMWFLDELEAGTPIYTVRRAYRLRGELDVDRLQSVLDTLAARHDSLRTTVFVRGGVPAAVVADEGGWPLDVLDFTTSADPEQGARDSILSHAKTPFDLQAGPLATAALYRLADDDAVLVLRMHHIIVDGWSVDVLVSELAALYAAGTGDAVLPPPPLPYPDFAVWQRQALDDDALSGQLGYWRQQLQGAPPMLELPTDLPRQPIATSTGRRRSLAFDPALSDAIRRVAREYGITPFTVLYAACSTLLHRLSGQDDIVLGTAIAGRQHPEVERSVGLFANTLVLRTDLSGDPSFAEVLRRSYTTVSQAQANQDVPFERLVEDLRPERELGRNPLFQVLINLQPPPHNGALLGDVTIAPYEVEAAFARFDLSFAFTETGDDLRATVDYRADLFTDKTAEAFLDRLVMLLDAGCAAPQTSADALPLLTDGEEERLLRYGTNLDSAPERTTVELIRAHVVATPDAIAVAADGHESLTYAELWRRSGVLADTIGRRVERGALVGIATERNPGLIVAVLATWRAGCAYVPIDNSYPAERVEYMLTQSGATLVLRDDDLRDLGPGEGSLIDEPTPIELAYVIYTSGSTGRPKGVAIRHRGLANLLTAMAQRPGFSASDVLPALTTFSFDMCGPELYLPLIVGGTVLLADRSVATDPDRLADFIEAAGVTVLQATPSAFRMLLDNGWPGSPTLRVFIGGEALVPELAARLLPRVGEVWNCYGPTETTIWSTIGRIEAADDILVGTPLDNTVAYVLDANRRLVPPGAQGELWLGGTGVAAGYLNRDDLTAERFRPDPFRADELIYRTGDLAVWTADGALRCLGRIDNQIKLRGYRIELNEIEVALESAPGVGEAVVVLREDHPGQQRLVAYVVGSADGLVEHLRAQLPAYMIPAAIVELAAVPRTPNGKTDRAALPVPQLVRGEVRRPTTPAELQVAEIWTQLLGVEDASIDDDFFAVGGHSLLATRLSARLAEAFGHTVELRRVFENPTLGELAASLAAEVEDGTTVAGPQPLERATRRIGPADLDDREAITMALQGKSSSTGELVVFPMSSMQTRMWLLNQMAPNDPRYAVPVLRWLRGPLDVPRLQAALADLVTRHEVLRTTYRQIDDLLVQIIHPTTEAALVEIDLPGQTADDARDAARALLDEPFDLVAGSALRLHLLRLDDAALLMVCAHHISLDGWSIDHIVSELAAAYNGESVPDPVVQFGDYAAWEGARPALADDRSYWHDRLAGAPSESSFPLSHPRPVGSTGPGRRIRRSLDEQLSARVSTVARLSRATPFSVLCAAVSALLTRHGSGSDVVLGSPFATRSFAGSEALIGPLINTLALRFDVAEDASFRAHLERTAAVCSDGFRHGTYPFDRLLAELDVERDPARHPLFQVFVSVQDARPDAVALGAALLEPVDIDWQVARYDTAFTFSVSGEHIELVFQYGSDVIDEPVAQWLVERFMVLLGAAVEDPERPIAELPVIGEDEWQAIERWKGSDLTADAPMLPALIADVTTAHPGRAAVRVHDEEIDYAQLQGRARAVARKLNELGIEPGDRVAVATGHSIHWPAAVLGIWAAGAVYVPLEPDYPELRRNFILDDSSCRALLVAAANATRFASTGMPVVVIDDLDDSAPDGRPHDRSADDPAYVIYTSGSTGKPKGVVVSHGSLASYIRAVRRVVYGDAPPAGLLVAVNSSTSFDVSISQLLHLGYGATLYPVPDPMRVDPPRMVEYLRRHRVGVLDATPTHVRLLLAAGLLEGEGGPSLVSVAGEAIDAELWAALRDSGRAAWNAYGPTETTIVVTMADITADESVSMGRPVPGVIARVVDAAERVVPVGVSGELWIGGTQVGMGYLDRPELTADRFVTRQARRWYRTGDLVRYRSDGELDFLGRTDDQVKIRGYRIELGEVATALRALPGIADAAAIAHEGRLVGAVVLDAGAELGPTAIRHSLRERVPAFLVPGVVVTLDRLPLLSSGKLDRSAVVAATLIAAEPSLPTQSARPPEGPAEELIAELWAALLGIETVSADDNFFDLGGDSLTASRFVAQLRAMDIDLPLMTIFTHPTVRALAEPLTEVLLGELGVGGD